MNADQIAQRDEEKPLSGNTEEISESRKRSLANLRPWKPGQSGNPKGRPKDHAAIIARAVFEENAEAIYDAMGKALLKGNAYTFKELAERAFGKIKEKLELTTGDMSELSGTDLNERIAQLERELGLARQIDEAGRVGIAQARAAEAIASQQDQ